MKPSHLHCTPLRRPVITELKDIPCCRQLTASEALIDSLLEYQIMGSLPSVVLQALTLSLLKLQPSVIPTRLITPEQADGSQITVDFELNDRITLSAQVAGRQTKAAFTITPAHPAWDCIKTCPERAHLHSQWRAWAEEPTEPEERRWEAVDRMLVGLLYDRQELMLNGLALTSLPPDFYSRLTCLNVSNNMLRTLPKLPCALRKLNAVHNELMMLPALPGTLSYMNVSHNRLTEITYFPDWLRVIDISNNRLVTLPNLPAWLQQLNASNNQLIRFVHPSIGLEWLNIRNNQLSVLPAFHPRLSTLFAMGNPLISIRAIPEGLRESDIYFVHVEDSAPQGLAQEAMSWAAHGQRNAFRTTWTAIECEENAPNFARFLHRLKESKHASHPEFRSLVATWLTELADTPALRYQTFVVALEGSESCTDRAMLRWNAMQTVRQLYHVEQQPDATPPATFHLLARRVFRIERVEEIAARKYKSIPLPESQKDEVEVYLAYFCGLKAPLNLPETFATDMHFSRLSHVTPADIDSAYHEVNVGEKQDFQNWLVTWEPCQKYLQRNMSQKQQEELAEQRLTLFEAEYDKMLRENADAQHDEAVLRLMSQQARTRCDNTLFLPLAITAFSPGRHVRPPR